MGGRQTGQPPGAGPEAARHLSQQQEQQHRGDRMQGHIHRVVPAGLQPEQLAIQHVRIGRQRMIGIGMPVVRIITQAAPGKAAIEMLVLIDVVIVIEVDEIVASRLAEDQNHGKDTGIRRSPTSRGDCPNVTGSRNLEPPPQKPAVETRTGFRTSFRTNQAVDRSSVTP